MESREAARLRELELKLAAMNAERKLVREIWNHWDRGRKELEREIGRASEERDALAQGQFELPIKSA